MGRILMLTVVGLLVLPAAAGASCYSHQDTEVEGLAFAPENLTAVGGHGVAVLAWQNTKPAYENWRVFAQRDGLLPVSYKIVVWKAGGSIFAGQGVLGVYSSPDEPFGFQADELSLAAGVYDVAMWNMLGRNCTAGPAVAWMVTVN